MIMKLNDSCMKSEDYLHKLQRKSAFALHKLYVLDRINIPTVKEILIHHVSLIKHFDERLSNVEEYEPNEQEIMEHKAMCDFLGIDYDNIPPME